MGAKTVEEQLEKYIKEGAHILIPSIKMGGLSEFHELVLDVMLLSPDPKEDDCYVQDKAYGKKPAKLALTAKAYQKLGMCASVEWDPQHTKTTMFQDDYVACSAVPCIRKADGTRACWFGEGDIDLNVEESKIRDALAAKVKGWLDPKNDGGEWFRKMSKTSQEAYADGKVSTDLNFKRQHKVKLAATSAKTRALKALLGTKSTYTEAELAKPFVMPRVIVRPNYKDPVVKQMMLAGAIQSMFGVYGGSMPKQIEGPAPIETEFHTVEQEAETEPDWAMGDGPGNEEEPPTDFENGTEKSQIEMLEIMIAQKGYDTGKMKKPLAEFTKQQRVAFWNMLTDLPDAVDDPFHEDSPF